VNIFHLYKSFIIIIINNNSSSSSSIYSSTVSTMHASRPGRCVCLA